MLERRKKSLGKLPMIQADSQFLMIQRRAFFNGPKKFLVGSHWLFEAAKKEHVPKLLPSWSGCESKKASKMLIWCLRGERGSFLQSSKEVGCSILQNLPSICSGSAASRNLVSISMQKGTALLEAQQMPLELGMCLSFPKTGRFIKSAAFGGKSDDQESTRANGAQPIAYFWWNQRQPSLCPVLQVLLTAHWAMLSVSS